MINIRKSMDTNNNYALPLDCIVIKSVITDVIQEHNMYKGIFTYKIIKTHDSESRGQEEAGRTRRMSVLFTGSTAMKLVNALNKPP